MNQDSFCHKCKYFIGIKNTEETSKGICTYTSDYESVDITKPCPYVPREYTLKCKDCIRYLNDYACFTCQEDDEVNDCCGYIDKIYEQIYDNIYQLFLQKRLDKDKILSIIDDVCNIELPQEKLT